jgi:hypothetical protein
MADISFIPLVSSAKTQVQEHHLKAASAYQDMSHDGTFQAMSQDVSCGDEDTGNSADAAPVLATARATEPAPAVAADATLG